MFGHPNRYPSLPNDLNTSLLLIKSVNKKDRKNAISCKVFKTSMYRNSIHILLETYVMDVQNVHPSQYFLPFEEMALNYFVLCRWIIGSLLIIQSDIVFTSYPDDTRLFKNIFVTDIHYVFILIFCLIKTEYQLPNVTFGPICNCIKPNWRKKYKNISISLRLKSPEPLLIVFLLDFFESR